MQLHQQVIDELRVRPGEAAGLTHRSTTETKTHWLAGDASDDAERTVAEHDLEEFRADLEQAQELLYASSTHSILIVLQALDAAGKDGTIKHVMSGVNPQGCEVTSFKAPSAEELGHDFLWRCEKALPERGHIGIFNRSYYEEVLVAKVHPEILTHQRIPALPGKKADVWDERYEDIKAFERHLERNGTHLIKVFLHLSRDEQRRRLLARLDDPSKYWKFSVADLAERARWDDYQKAYEQAVTATSTDWAPWYVIPADHKYLARALVGGILAHTIRALDLKTPEVGEDQLAALAKAKESLLAE